MTRQSSCFRALANGAVVLTLVAGAVGAVPVQAAPLTPSASFAAADETAVSFEVSIQGSAKVGHDLTAAVTAEDPAGAEFTYRWQVSEDGSPYGDATGPGANEATYTVVGADAGGTLRVTVTGEAEGYTPTSTEMTTSAVQKGDIVVNSVVFTGNAPVTVGKIVHPSISITPAGVRMAYRWRRSSGPGGDWVDIPGGTGSSYTPTAEDLGRDLALFFTATAEGYNTYNESADHGFVAGVTQAAPPPPTKPDFVRVDDATPRRGQRVYVTSGYARPGATFKIVIAGRTVHTGRVHSNGRIWNTVTVPLGASVGRHLIQVIEYNSRGARVDTDKLGITVH